MNVNSLIAKLDRLKSSREPFDTSVRIDLIDTISENLSNSAVTLSRLHDILLFLVAHTTEKTELSKAERVLGQISRRVRQGSRVNPQFLHNSGIAGSRRTDSFSFDLFDIISEKKELSSEFRWNKDNSLGEKFDEFLQECVFSSERDSVMYDQKHTKTLLLELHGKKSTTLRWFVAAVKARRIEPKSLDRIVDSLDLWIDWQCSGRSWSRTTLRFPKSSNKVELLDVCRGALAVRGRETDTVIYTTAPRVNRICGKNGIEIGFFELSNERRLAIECYVGFVAARNRVPVAYGGAWMLGHRAEIGVNIFEEFRGGDSRGLFSEIIDQYRKIYGVNQFLVQPYQFGGDNVEALKSGAFWFYYRLGFRPDDRAIAKLAEKESLKRKKRPTYRCSIGVLKKLSEKQLVLTFDRRLGADDKKLVTQEIGYLILKSIGAKFGGNKALARKEACKIWKSLPGLKNKAMPEIGFLLLLLPKIDLWSQREKRDLKVLLALKDGITEREFVISSQKHMRFRKELKRMLTQIN